MTQPHAYELVRSLLIFMHLAAMIAAGISIAFGDYAILRHRPVNRDLMIKASRAVTWSLVALWITGLSVISLDMSTVSLTLAKAPKLQAKLTVVLILTANGFLLHRYTLTALGGRKRPTEQQVKLSAILGAVSATSWGYTAMAQLEYSNVFAGINLKPNLAWSHDVHGYSPVFNEGSKAVSVGVDADYRSTYTASLSYTNFFGGDFNTNVDRDFVALSFGVNF